MGEISMDVACPSPEHPGIRKRSSQTTFRSPVTWKRLTAGCRRRLRVPGTSRVFLHGLAGEWPAKPDADVEDDAGSDEAEGGGGDPLIGGGPCPVDAVGVGGQRAVERERD